MQGNSAGRMTAGEATDARQSQIGISISRMSSAVERLAHAVDRLESRVSPAMRPSTPVPSAPANRIEKVQELKAPVADAIDAMTMRAELIEARLLEMTDRVEV